MDKAPKFLRPFFVRIPSKARMSLRFFKKHHAKKEIIDHCITHHFFCKRVGCFKGGRVCRFFWVRRSDNSNDPARSIVRWTNEDAYMVQWWEACDGVIPSLNWIKENGSFHRCCGRNGSWNNELFDVYLWNRKKTWCFFICYVRFSWMDWFWEGFFLVGDSKPISCHARWRYP